MADLYVDVGSIGAHFKSLTDPRHERNRKHLLVDIVVISICGILCGASGPTAIHRWAKSKHEWLAKHLALPHGIPSRSCLRRLLTILNQRPSRSVSKSGSPTVSRPISILSLFDFPL